MKKGSKHSEEAKRKIGKSKNGNKNCLGHKFTEKHKRKISEAHKGKFLTEETKRKISKILKGKYVKEKHHFFGKHHTEKTKRKLSQALKGRISPMKGKHLSEETKKKISIANKGKYVSKETRLKMSGEENPMWQGGISFEPYGVDFNNSFKEKIRERDNHCCVICNKLQEEFKEKLHIHHIDYIKINNFPQNCVSLCRSCHTKTNINRNAWKSFFQQLLKERYGYEYSEEQKIILDFTN